MKDGYYWVLRYYDWEWEIGLLENGIFSFIQDEDTYKIEDIDIIGDYIETPDKYKDGK